MISAYTIPLLRSLVPLVALSACGGEDPIAAPDRIEWNAVATPLGSMNVAVVRPDNEGSENHPVVFGLAWGSGDRSLVEGFIQSYWLTEPGSRGYYVVVPEVTGSSMEADANDVLPALFDWMEAELSVDLDQVVIVGSSNGGRGLFFAAVAQPDRFQALLGMPGMYQRDPNNLAPLAGKSIRIIVGEFDDNWRDGVEQTRVALESVGITPEIDIAGTQGHVLDLNPVGLMDWIDASLGR